MRKPEFFIVGAPRCGTESMKYYLAEHPDIFLPKDEIYFFSTDLKRTELVKPLSEERYMSIFSGRREKILGEKTSWYLYSKVAARKIKEFNPSAKIIIMLRNPVDAVFSKYLLSYYSGYEWLPFEKAIEVENLRKEGKFLRVVPYIDFYFYISLYMYYDQVKRYFENFPRERIKIIIHDDYKSDTPKIYREVIEFLGADSSFQPRFKKYNSSRVHLHPALREIRYFCALVYPYYMRKFGIPIWARLPLSILSFATIKMIDKISELNSKKPKMQQQVREKLKNVYKDDIYKLSELIDRDLTHWVR